MTLAEFLLARIAEDERIALAAEGEPRDAISTLGFLQGSALSEGDRIVAHPARVVAECEAKRRIVEWALDDSSGGPDAYPPDEIVDVIRDRALTPVLRLLALSYADHPDYQQEWRP